MKARRKSDGKIIEVEVYMLNSRRGKDGSWESSYKDINSGLVYEASELLFNLDYYTVIQGWVGRDMSGSLYVYCHEPERNLMKCLWEGDIMSISLSDDMFPDLTWDSDPEEVEIILKRKKK